MLKQEYFLIKSKFIRKHVLLSQRQDEHWSITKVYIGPPLEGIDALAVSYVLKLQIDGQSNEVALPLFVIYGIPGERVLSSTQQTSKVMNRFL